MSDQRPWTGADRDKEKHPRLGRLVDNLWVLAVNRVLVPVLGAAAVALFSFGYGKITLLDKVSYDTTRLIIAVDKLVDKAGTSDKTLTQHTDQIAEIPKIVENMEKNRADLEKKLDGIEDKLNATSLVVQKLHDYNKNERNSRALGVP